MNLSGPVDVSLRFLEPSIDSCLVKGSLKPSLASGNLTSRGIFSFFLSGNLFKKCFGKLLLLEFLTKVSVKILVFF